MNNNEEGAKKMLDYNNIPVGLSMALAQNTGALEHFAKMTDAERHSVINKARCVQTKHEMQDFKLTYIRKYPNIITACSDIFMIKTQKIS